MNDADPSPINLDELRLLPDWLREEGPAPSKQYASHEGGAADEAGARRGTRPGAFNRDRPGNRGFGGGGGSSGDRRRDGGRRPGLPARGGDNRAPRDDRRPAPQSSAAPAPVKVEFLPDEKCLASITKQIRSTHMAYPLFGLARMFLQEPARHWVQFTLVPGTVPTGTALYQLDEEGPVTLDRAILERIAFDAAKDRYYVEQIEQKEPPKGNFANVARNRLSGALLGPTNYHGYQPSLRADYENGFSRRMSFEDYRRNVEVVTDPALVERWKEEARTTTIIATREGEPPTILPTATEARVHFRQHYLERLLRTGPSFKLHGSVARNLPEPAMMQAIRQAHDTELRYPAQFVQLLRQGLQNAGLHIFKHRKRVVYVSLARPVPFSPDGAVSENVAAILATVAQFPQCTRKMLADKVLGVRIVSENRQSAPASAAVVAVDAAESSFVATSSTPESIPSATEAPTPREEIAGNSPSPVDHVAPTLLPPSVEPVTATDKQPDAAQSASENMAAKAKAALAADLRFLVQAGHIIEFHNGTFDLPLVTKAKEELPSDTVTAAAKPYIAQLEAATDVQIDDASAMTADDAERNALTVDSVTISAPDDQRTPEQPIPVEASLEKTEAMSISGHDNAEAPGISSTDTPPAAADDLVIGDVESAHPLSPL